MVRPLRLTARPRNGDPQDAQESGAESSTRMAGANGFAQRGPTNSLTDVPGVRVGHVTLISGEGALKPGQGPVRTGITAIIPGDEVYDRTFAAGVHVINGFGKMIGLPQIQELGRLETPIMLTNTFSVWDAAIGLVDYTLRRHPRIGIDGPTCNPVVGECNDGWLNDIRGRHVRPEHAVQALEAAGAGPVGEDAVGAGTGMVCYGFKGGIGFGSTDVRSVVSFARRNREGRAARLIGLLIVPAEMAR